MEGKRGSDSAFLELFLCQCNVTDFFVSHPDLHLYRIMFILPFLQKWIRLDACFLLERAYWKALSVAKGHYYPHVQHSSNFSKRIQLVVLYMSSEVSVLDDEVSQRGNSEIKSLEMLDHLVFCKVFYHYVLKLVNSENFIYILFSSLKWPSVLTNILIEIELLFWKIK